MSINKNQETFKEEFGPFKITEKTKDITKPNVGLIPVLNPA